MTHSLSRKQVTQSGLTLIELSIVLVVIGLITGGVLIGQDMIRNAQLRSVIEDKEKYISAVQQYRNRYQAMPGDHATASDYFTQSSTCGGSSEKLTAVCDGDGDNWVEAVSVTFGSASDDEVFYLWRHLYAADLFGERLSGTSSSGIPEIGVNIPMSKLEPGAWQLSTLGISSSSPYLFEGDYWHTIILMGADGMTQLPLLTASETLAIEKKVDDGMPATGFVRAPYVMTNCVLKADLTGLPSRTDFDAVYAVGANDPNDTAEEISCAIVFPNVLK